MIQEVKKTLKKPLVKKNGNGASGKVAVTTEMIAKKAYELYENRGCKDGYAEADWLEAKRLLEAG